MSFLIFFCCVVGALLVSYFVKAGRNKRVGKRNETHRFLAYPCAGCINTQAPRNVISKQDHAYLIVEPRSITYGHLGVLTRDVAIERYGEDAIKFIPDYILCPQCALKVRNISAIPNVEVPRERWQ